MVSAGQMLSLDDLCVWFGVVGIAVVTSLAGSGNPGFADGVGTQASFHQLWDVAVDANGHLFVADANNQRVRKISSTGGVFEALC